MSQPKLQLLPPKENLRTIEIYKHLTEASRALAELKGESKTIPNETILINTLGLQEAKDSSAIENIITTQDDLYRADVDDTFDNIAAKEVKNYSLALKHGFELVKEHRLLTNNYILEIQKMIEPVKHGFRKLPGTVLKNSDSETIYTPPQDANEVINLMSNLEKYINKDELHDIDPLVKMAVIHYQFENILYLVQKGLLDIPVLYLSRYIIKNKREYYRHLQAVREKGDWDKWIIWILQGIIETSIHTFKIISQIKELMFNYKHRIRNNYKFYTHDLLNNLFSHPYTKIEFIERDLKVSRKTASTYLNTLAKDGFLEKIKIKQTNFFLNRPLFKLFLSE